MSKEIGIGKANRLARIGEMVSVSINGKTITAKVATNLSSTKVLVLFDGRTYHAYPESQRTIVKSQKTVLAKHERRKQRSEVTTSVAILFEVRNYSQIIPRENDTSSYYVSVDGSVPRHILTTSVRVRAPLADGSGSDTSIIRPLADATLTYFGNGRYRGSIKYGLVRTQRFIEDIYYTMWFYTNMMIFTESSTRTYGLGADIPRAPEDWQDMRLRGRFVGSYTNERYRYEATGGSILTGGSDLNNIRNLYLSNVGDITSNHPCFLDDPFGEAPSWAPRSVGGWWSKRHNLDVKNQIMFYVGTNQVHNIRTTGVNLTVQAWNYSKILSEIYQGDVCTMSNRYIKGDVYVNHFFPKIELPGQRISGVIASGFVTWSNYRDIGII